MNPIRSIAHFAVVALAVVAPLRVSMAAPLEGQALAAAREQAVARAVDFLRTKGQADDGSYSAASGPAVTALVTTALLRNGRTPNDPQIAKSLKYLEGFVQPD